MALSLAVHQRRRVLMSRSAAPLLPGCGSHALTRRGTVDGGASAQSPEGRRKPWADTVPAGGLAAVHSAADLSNWLTSAPQGIEI
jgi:hypothetical protein